MTQTIPIMTMPLNIAPTKTIKTAIIEDRTEIREGIARLVERAPGFTCTGAYGSMEEALARIAGNMPDIVLCDIGLPGMSGIEGMRILKEQHPQLVALVLTIHTDDERIFDALCAGASGYMLKTTTPQKLLESLKEAVAGGAPMSPEVARRVIGLFRDFRPPSQATHDLTPHEVRLLKLLVDGYSYKAAASELGVTVNTIKFHLRSIYDKLQVHSKSEAVAKALRHGLTH